MSPALPPLGDARPDWVIVRDLAGKMIAGAAVKPDPAAPFAGWDYDSPGRVMEEIAALTPSYGGVRHDRLGTKGLQWPCPFPDHPGTSILHVGRFTRGRGKLSAVDHIDPAEIPDEAYPFLLTTGRILYHYHSGSLSRRSKGLSAHVPEGKVEIHPEDACRLGIGQAEKIRIVSRRGEVLAAAEVTERVPPGITFMTFHFAEAAANLLTNPALDPVAKIPEYKACAVRIERIEE